MGDDMNEQQTLENMTPQIEDTSHIQVRNIRKRKGISLKEFSALSGLSVSFLSNYENSKVNISVASLKRISAALDVPISQLLAGDMPGEVIVVKREDRYVIPHHKTRTGMAYTDYLIRGISTAMDVTVTRLPPHSDTGECTTHSGEEYVYVLHGVGTVIINDNRYLLQEGDMIYYLSKCPHKVSNDQDSELEYIQTNTPPTF